MKNNKDKDDLQIKFSNSGKDAVVTDSSGTKTEVKNKDILKKGSNVIELTMTKSGYIVKVNDETLTDEAKSAGLATVSKVNVKKLTGTLSKLVIGSTRY